MIAPQDLTAIWVTFKLASIFNYFTTDYRHPPIAWWLSQKPGKFKKITEAVIALPLILPPPQVLGFYLLIAFSPNGLIGQIVAIADRSSFGLHLQRSGDWIGVLLFAICCSAAAAICLQANSPRVYMKLQPQWEPLPRTSFFQSPHPLPSAAF